ncbi:multi-component transcriptional regulator, winged helix family protein [Anabaenopsis circularis NIES-21]|uniref:Multi-component transcriptional regulator, winged helix family protein n=1 Tax=Anabaenopsis circularis NIES-21 TaxID=1085406 RepID=A0A1Z4GEU0_9CYAN|nr:multi-component transcriptional regulator, winged helix family protein [Anabaenopsis circularis NIES-21]
MKILIVEDDTNIIEILRVALSEKYYLVEVATDGKKGLEQALATAYDLIVLDVSLSIIDGISICQQLRNQGCCIPILLLTEKDNIAKTITGLDAGADDYVLEPFNLEELLARIRALLRRGMISTTPIIQFGALLLDPRCGQISYQGKILPLTAKEYALLELLLRNSQRIFSQSSLLDHLWSLNEIPSENTVRAHIKSLRSKLRKAGAKADLIETVYGFGYRLNTKELEIGNVQPKIMGTEKPIHSIKADEESDDRLLPTTDSAIEQRIKSQLAGVWERYQDKYSDRLAIIKQAVKYLLENRLTEDLRQQAQQQAHTLAGSLGTFGFDNATCLCQNIETILKSTETLGQTQAEQIQMLLLELQKILEQNPTLIPPQSDVQATYLNQEYRLLIVDDDLELAQQVAAEATIAGIETVVAESISAARLAIAHSRPDVVLLDLCFPQSPEDGFTLLAELTALHPPIPVLVFTSQDSFTERVKVARMGGKGFLQKPVFPSEIMEAIATILQQSNTSSAKLLIVDDDPQILDILHTILQPWGFTLTLLDDPQNFWDTLEEFIPDMLILDLEMPNFSGIDLCQVVRNDPHWSNLPILFLSAHRDTQIVQRVFAAGADDYVTKPIVEPELLARVLCRLERSQIIRKFAEIDALTGITNRRKSAQELTRLLHLAERQNQPFYFAVLDLDRFKYINDQYGHDAGDQVLSQLGKLLKQSFRQEDVVARWGGEEFVIGLYGITQQQVVKRLNHLLDSLRCLEFTTSNQENFTVTISAGVAEYPKDGHDVQTLYRAADAALYQAKAAGRDQIFLSAMN